MDKHELFETITDASGTLMASALQCLKGEELDDFIRRHVAMTAQLLATLGCNLQRPFDDVAEEGISLAHRLQDKGRRLGIIN